MNRDFGGSLQILGILVLLAAALTAGPVQGAISPTFDALYEGPTRNDTLQTATLLATGTPHGLPPSLRGTIETVADVDWYRVRAGAGDLVSVKLTVATTPGPDFRLCAYRLDGVTELTVLEDSFLISGRVAAVTFTAPVAGDYPVRVSNGAERDRYDMFFGVIPKAGQTSIDLRSSVLDAPRGVTCTAGSPGSLAVTGSFSFVWNLQSNSQMHMQAGLMLSADQVLNADDQLLAVFGGQGFSAGDTSLLTSTFQGTVSLPPLPPGSYSLGLLADPLNQIAEANESNNASALVPFPVTVLDSAGAPAPDLEAISATGPATGAAGQSIALSGTVRNSGPLSAAAFDVAFHLCRQAALLPGDRRLGVVRVTGLTAGASRVVTLAAQLPPSVVTGQYRIGLAADSANALLETTETNNTIAGTGLLQLTAPTDLTVTSVQAAPAATLGATLAVRAGVRNLGPGNAAATTIQFVLSTDREYSAPGDRLLGAPLAVPSLPAGAAHDAIASPALPQDLPEGAYYVGAVLDPARVLSDPARGNNVSFVSTATVVSLPELPDLQVLSLTAPATATPAGELTLTARVSNAGRGSSPQSLAILFSLAGQGELAGVRAVLGEASRAALAPGASADLTATFVLPAVLGPGSYLASAAVDPRNQIVEVNEANNGRTASAPTLLARQQVLTDLAAGTVTVPGFLAAGASFVASGQVTNRGTASVGVFPVAFVLSSGGTAGLASPLLGSTSVAGGLAAGETRVVTAVCRLPADQQGQTATVALLVDAADHVPETDEANNVSFAAGPTVFAGPLSTDGLPDLTVTQVSIAPPAPTSLTGGQRLAVRAGITNAGLADVRVPFRASFVLSVAASAQATGLVPLGAVAAAPLSTGAFIVVSGTFPVPLLPPGTYYLGAQVDPERAVADRDRTNNLLLSQTPMTLATSAELAALSDLSAVSVEAVAGVTPGTTFPVRVSVAARNNAAVLPVPALLVLSQTAPALSAGALPLGRLVLPVSPGGSAQGTLSAFVPAGFPAGNYHLGLVVDPLGAFPEVDEANNVLVLAQFFAVAPSTPPADDFLPAPGTAFSAAAVSAGAALTAGAAPLRGSLEQPGDLDAYHLDVAPPLGGTLQFLVEPLGVSALSVELIAPDGSRLAATPGGLGQPLRLANVATASAGRYFLLVRHGEASGIGAYAVSASRTALPVPAPDLAAAGISIDPAAPTTRDVVSLRWALANAGSTTAPACAWLLRLERPACPDCPGGVAPQPLVLARGRLGPLAARTSISLGPLTTGPWSAGDYRLALSVDTLGEVDELSESNNSAVLAFTAGLRGAVPDLLPAGITVEPFMPTVATTRTVALGAVANRGASRTPAFDVSVVLDRSSVAAGTVLTVFRIDGLRPDSVTPLPPVRLPALARGAHSVSLELDLADEVPESREDNNSAGCVFQVSQTPGAGFQLVPGLLSIDPPAPGAGDTVRLGGLVANRGLSAAPGATVEVLLDGQPVGQPLALGSVAAGAVATLPPTVLGQPLAAGTHRVSVRVTASGGTESEPLDNEASLTFAVGASSASRRVLGFSGVVRDLAGNPLQAGGLVRVLNRSRGLASYASPVPAVASLAGSYRTTLGSSSSLSSSVAGEGDRLEFLVQDASGRLATVAAPAGLTVSAADLALGTREVDLTVAPAQAGQLELRLLGPATGDVFYADERVTLEGLGVGRDGHRLFGRQLRWLDGASGPVLAVGERVAVALTAGRHHLVLEASDGLGGPALRSVDVEVVSHPERSSSRLRVAGNVRSASGSLPAGLSVRAIHLASGRQVQAGVQQDGRYSVELLRLDGPAVALGDTVRLEALDAQGRPLAATPGSLEVGLRELATGEHLQDLRLGTVRKQWRLFRGLNLLSVPVNPDTTGRAVFTAAELARRTGAGYVARVSATADGAGRFEIYLEGLTPSFPVQGNEGYILHRQGSDATVELEGVAWAEGQASRTLPRGIGLLGLPFGPQPNQTVQDLLEQSGGDFAVRAVGGRFEAFLSGGASSFSLEDGMGYIVAAPRPQPVTLPGQP